MLEFSYFFVTMVTVLMSSTVGTVLLVRACVQGHIKRGWAVFWIVALAVGLPVAVPFAVAAVFMQVIQLMSTTGAMPVTQAQNLMFTILGSILTSLALSAFAAFNGIRKLPQA